MTWHGASRTTAAEAQATSIGLALAVAALRRFWHDRGLTLLTAVLPALALLLAAAQPAGLLALHDTHVLEPLQQWNAHPPLQLLPVAAASGVKLDVAMIERASRWSGVAHVMPHVQARAVPRAGAAALQLWATQPGDPLLGRLPPPRGRQLALGAAAAQALGVRSGDALSFALRRERDGAVEAAVLPLQVASVAPESSALGQRALVSLPLMLGLQAWASGRAETLPADEPDAPADSAGPWPALRLHLGQAWDLPPVLDRLRLQGLEPPSHAALVDSLLRLRDDAEDAALRASALTVGGVMLALSALQLLLLRRRRSEHRLFRLAGQGTGTLLALHVCEAIVLVLVAGLLTGVLVALLTALGASSGARVPAGLALAMAAAVLLPAVGAALWAAREPCSLSLP